MLFFVVNINATVVFEDIEDFKNLIILKILKEKLVMSCLLGSFYFKIVSSFSNSTVQVAVISKAMVKFRSKFQFRIPLQFYRTAEKVTKIKFVMVMVKRFDKCQLKSFQPSHVGYYCFFIIEIQAY